MLQAIGPLIIRFCIGCTRSCGCQHHTTAIAAAVGASAAVGI
jgi:hypothetical protein